MAAIAELLETRRRLILLLGVPLIVALALVRSDLDTVLRFDDAFMFWRYALNLREGFGMAWNPGGEATYGLTSQLWVYFVLPFTYTSLAPAKALQIAPLMMGLAGFMLGGVSVARTGLRLPIYIGLLVLLLLVGPFAFHMTTGMDTMLSFTTNVALLAAVERWRDHQRSGAVLVGVAAFVTVLARPENLFVAFGVPALAWLLLRPERKFHDILLPIGLPGVLLAANLLVCYRVYGTPLPLSFYAKSGAAYEGFLNRENPVRYMANAMPAALPSLALCLVFGRGHWRYLAVMAIPVAVTFLYLATVHQVMGFQGRYYMPFLPFVVFPAAVVTADALERSQRMGISKFWLLAVVPVAALVLLTGKQALASAEAAWHAWTLPAPVPQSVPLVSARTGLPRLAPTQAWSTAATIARRLPAGTVLAASEVGSIGGYAPHVIIIDMAGLNDREIGMNGFSADRLIARGPDLIWLPHEDYTGARAALLASEAFRNHYRLLVGAFDYGLAVRTDGPRTAAVERVVADAWSATYPGLDQSDYVARWPSSQPEAKTGP